MNNEHKQDLFVYLNPIFNDYNNVEFSWENYLNDVTEARNKKCANKDLIAKASKEFLIDGSDLPETKFYTDIGTAHIEGFFKQGKSKKLFIFFGGSRSRNGGRDRAPLPTFSRWSWYTDTDASILSLEDPMYYTYPDCILGWFYGTETEDYRRQCAKCIKKIANQLEIENKNLIFYGGSGGGTAAIAVSAFFPGAVCVAINPQLDLEHYYPNSVQRFEESTGLKITGSECSRERCLAAEIVKKASPENKFIILTNLHSSHDFKVQLKSFCEALEITPEYGIKQTGNVINWIFDAYGAMSEHSSFENRTIFKTIEFLIECINNNADVKETASFFKMINEFYFERYDLLRKNVILTNENKKLQAEKKELKIKSDKETSELKKDYYSKNKYIRSLVRFIVKSYDKIIHIIKKRH